MARRVGSARARQIVPSTWSALASSPTPYPQHVALSLHIRDGAYRRRIVTGLSEIRANRSDQRRASLRSITCPLSHAMTIHRRLGPELPPGLWRITKSSSAALRRDAGLARAATIVGSTTGSGHTWRRAWPSSSRQRWRSEQPCSRYGFMEATGTPRARSRTVVSRRVAHGDRRGNQRDSSNGDRRAAAVDLKTDVHRSPDRSSFWGGSAALRASLFGCSRHAPSWEV